jgi:four helix bundle protein
MISLSWSCTGPSLTKPMHNHEREIMAYFQKLEVWGIANEILAVTYKHHNAIRGETVLRDQMKRAAISIVSNIAEGSERRTNAEVRNFYVIARASASELNAQYHIVRACGLLTTDVVDKILDQLDHCGRMLTKLIQYLGRT